MKNDPLTFRKDWSQGLFEISRYRHQSNRKRYAASRTEPVNIKFLSENSKLDVEGALIDKVKQLSKPLHHNNTAVRQNDFHRFFLGRWTFDIRSESISN